MTARCGAAPLSAVLRQKLHCEFKAGLKHTAEPISGKKIKQPTIELNYIVNHCTVTNPGSNLPIGSP